MTEQAAESELRKTPLIAGALGLLAAQITVAVSIHPTLFPGLAGSSLRELMLFLLPVLSSVITVQVAMALECTRPQRLPWYFSIALIALGSVLTELPLAAQYLSVVEADLGKLLSILWVSSCFQIMTCLILLKCLAPFCSLWLVRPGVQQPQLLASTHPRRWSIRGYLMLTLAVAVAIAVFQQLQWSGFSGQMMVRRIALVVSMLASGFLAAYWSSGGRRLVVTAALSAAILLGAAIYFLLRYAIQPTSPVPGLLAPVAMHIPLSLLSILLHLALFRCWKRAGFQLLRWRRGQTHGRQCIMAPSNREATLA